MLKFRHIAPAGTDITIRDLIGWGTDILSGKDRSQELKSEICRKYQVKHCFLTSSARAAMAMIFEILVKQFPEGLRDEIILPSYTCYSVAAAAEWAGLKLRICEIDPVTLDYDHDALVRLDTSRAIAIVSANLYGNPNSLDYLEQFACENDLYFIDDAAQSMNAKLNMRYAGTFGDIGVFSLDKGKNITTVQGGIIVTNNDSLANQISEVIDEYPYPALSQRITLNIKLLIYSFLLKPNLYWIPAGIGWLGLGKTRYTTDFLFTRYNKSLSSIALRLFRRIDEISEGRRSNARSIRKVLESFTDIRFIDNLKESESVSLRQALVINNPDKRDIFVRLLQSEGIGASTSYPMSLSDLQDIANIRFLDEKADANGRFVAERIITLPTISYMSQNDFNRMRALFQNYFD